MLQLIQIMNYMLTHLEYTSEEVEEYFKAVESGNMSIETAITVLGLELWSPAIMENLKEKFHKWPSALAVTKMRLGESA